MLLARLAAYPSGHPFDEEEPAFVFHSVGHFCFNHRHVRHALHAARWAAPRPHTSPN